MNSSAIASVMFMSAVVGRSSGVSTCGTLRNAPGLSCAQPIDPTPGKSPNQFEARMKIKRVARNANVLEIMCRPTMLSSMS